MNYVITIGREHGSGGRAISKRLAERLGVECYDSRIITEVVKRSGINEKLFQAYRETPVDSLLYSITMSTQAAPGTAWQDRAKPLSEQIHRAQFQVMNELAKTPCVIVGRCADSVVVGDTPKCRVFICSDMQHRIARIMETYSVTEEDAKKLIQRTDKERASYYNFYTNKQWGDSRNYDLCLNTAGMEIDDAVDIILAYVEKMK